MFDADAERTRRNDPSAVVGAFTTTFTEFESHTPLLKARDERAAAGLDEQRFWEAGDRERLRGDGRRFIAGIAPASERERSCKSRFARARLCRYERAAALP